MLKRILVDEYSGFDDKRIVRLEPGSTITVDDRGPADYSTEKKLLPWFCEIFVDIQSEEQVTVRLVNGVPISDEIRRWVELNKYQLTEQPRLSLSVSITKGDQEKLIELARLVDDVVSRGRRLAEPSYKYICPRTSVSLRRLQQTLSRAWNR